MPAFPPTARLSAPAITGVFDAPTYKVNGRAFLLLARVAEAEYSRLGVIVDKKIFVERAIETALKGCQGTLQTDGSVGAPRFSGFSKSGCGSNGQCPCAGGLNRAVAKTGASDGGIMRCFMWLDRQICTLLIMLVRGHQLTLSRKRGADADLRRLAPSTASMHCNSVA